jgi:hypothetical protein
LQANGFASKPAQMINFRSRLSPIGSMKLEAQRSWKLNAYKILRHLATPWGYEAHFTSYRLIQLQVFQNYADI